ncbi:VTC domain-containing protein [Pseudobutyrivibrio sp. YE44]|uniref:polyphosphate polymerase domain-containing protein n=1 Tax=Pseudobutyrivibrio sp. YE44 TaxID=1520802 RepID=UPI00087E1ECE|nr:polyphosphate polymerase domain-containing protein [Pseudobutyrivibrio sp. YE44]SDB11690.1 VTC domain-containing protein [Pseudobutyrivibrio sp. YE44]
MGQIQKVFNRYEKKFLLDEKTYLVFKKELDEYMNEDEYGLHTIRNIYYDTPTDELIRTSIEGPKYKEKFRVRCYGKPTYDSMCFLEIKKKYKGLVNKRRVAIPMEEAESYLIDGQMPSNPNQIFKEIDYFFSRYPLEPKRYIAYDRLAMYGKEDPEFRVTFDINIRSRDYNLTLYSDEDNEYLLEPGQRLMEVKISDSMPLWFARLLSKYQIYPTSFSKYGNFYKKQLKEA